MAPDSDAKLEEEVLLAAEDDAGHESDLVAGSHPDPHQVGLVLENVAIKHGDIVLPELLIEPARPRQ